MVCEFVESMVRRWLFWVSKQNLNPSSWRIWHINNHWKQIKNEKAMAPQSKGGQELKNKPMNITKVIPNIQKLPCMLLLLLEFKDDLHNFNCLKWVRNKKVMRLESRWGYKEKKNKNAFCKLKSLFFLALFFPYSFFFALQRWYLELDIRIPYHFKSLNMKHIWQRYKSMLDHRQANPLYSTIVQRIFFCWKNCVKLARFGGDFIWNRDI
jgi:hypothetical protein